MMIDICCCFGCFGSGYTCKNKGEERKGIEGEEGKEKINCNNLPLIFPIHKSAKAAAAEVAVRANESKKSDNLNSFYVEK